MSDTATTITAIIGCITGASSLVWQIITHSLTKGRLRIEGQVITTRLVPGPELAQLEITINNVGQRPVEADSWYVEYKDGTVLPMKQSSNKLPKMLQENERLTELWAATKVLNPEIVNIWVMDSRRRKYYMSSFALNKLLEEFEHLNKPDHSV